MKTPFQPGDIQEFSVIISEKDVAHFDQQQVHDVYATFAIARDFEWAGRLFVLQMIEENEEGIGTMVEVNHIAPALIHQKVQIVARLDSLIENEIICSMEARVGKRLIATGRTGQKIMNKERINRIFAAL
jgi:fluoroacetyl-CoA thioesterase